MFEKGEVDILKKTLIIVSTIFLGVLICGVSAFAACPSLQFKWYLNQDDCLKAATIYNESLAETADEEYTELMLEYIDETKARWKEEEISYREAVINLENLKIVNNKEVSGEAKYMSDYIEREGFGKECYAKAEAYSLKEDYIHAMKMLYQIDENYLEYSKVENLNNLCKDAILKETEKLDTIDELKEAIQRMDEYFAMVPEAAFAVRKGQLEKELSDLKDVIQIVKEASEFYDAEDYKNAFAVLETGLEKYPDNVKMKEGYFYYLELYVEMIAEEAQEACDKKEYREALRIVEEALEVHDCEPLQQLLIHVKEERNVLYRWWNDVKDFWGKFDMR